MQGNGSNTAQYLPQRIWHPHCLGLVSLLTLEYIGCGDRKPYSAFHSVREGIFQSSFLRKGPCSCALGPLWCKAKQGEWWGQLLKRSWSKWECPGRHTQKMQGEFAYGMENLLTRVVFAVPALLNYLWQGSLLASSLYALSQWSLCLLPTWATWWEQRTPLLLLRPPVCTDALSSEELWERTRCSFLTLENDWRLIILHF